MKKIINILGLSMILGLFGVSCSDVDPDIMQVEGIEVEGLINIENIPTLTLAVGNIHQLKAAFMPLAAKDMAQHQFAYEIYNEKFATISEEGVITAIEQGITTVVVTSASAPNLIRKTFNLAVELPVTDITLNATEFTLNEGKTAQIVAAVLPEEATNAGLAFTSNNDAIATVDAKGKITAVEEGTAVITVKSKGNPEVLKTVTITVTPVLATSIEVSPSKLQVLLAKTETFVATVKPDNAKNKELTFKSDKEDIATVDAEGVVTGVKVGTAIITITSVGNPAITKTLEVEVVDKPITWVEDAVRKTWVVTTTHQHIVPKDIDVNDVGILGTPESLVDGDNRSCLTLVKPGKTFEGANGSVTVGEAEKVGFTLNLQARTKFNYVFILPRELGGIVGLLVKKIKLEGSNDGIVWTAMEDAEIPVIVPTLATDPRGSEPVKLTKVHEYQYIRATYLDYHATNGSTAQVAEFKLGLQE